MAEELGSEESIEPAQGEDDYLDLDHLMSNSDTLPSESTDSGDEVELDTPLAEEVGASYWNPITPPTYLQNDSLRVADMLRLVTARTAALSNTTARSECEESNARVLGQLLRPSTDETDAGDADVHQLYLLPEPATFAIDTYTTSVYTISDLPSSSDINTAAANTPAIIAYTLPPQHVAPSTPPEQGIDRSVRRAGSRYARFLRMAGLHSAATGRSVYRATSNIPSSSLPVKGESYCDCLRLNRDAKCSCGEEDSADMEWLWDSTSKSHAIDLSDNESTAIFHVSYSSGTAATRGTMPFSDKQYFWEVKMTSPVYGTDMMVGIATENMNLDLYRNAFVSLLGRDADSWGLSYYGRLQHKGKFNPVKHGKFGQGTIIGVHVDMWFGTLTFYKNRRIIARVMHGLNGKKVYPVVTSTAARTSMKVIKACSFPTSLQFICCQKLRQFIPQHRDVVEALRLPPGLRAFLENNLSWLLRPSELPQNRVKRKQPVPTTSTGEQGAEEVPPPEREDPPNKKVCSRK